MRRALLITTLLLFAVPAPDAPAKPLVLEITYADETCRASHPLRIDTDETCQIADVPVTSSGGTVPVRFEVLRLDGCPEIDALVRTQPASFTRLAAGPGPALRTNLTNNLGTPPVDWTAPKGAMKIHLQGSYRSCETLRSYRIRATFPTLEDASAKGRGKASKRCRKARARLRKARRSGGRTGPARRAVRRRCG